MIIDATEKYFNVVLGDIPENWVITQKQESLAWENTIDPDPIAKIHPILSASVSKPIVESMGLINAAVVKTAMVEDP